MVAVAGTFLMQLEGNPELKDLLSQVGLTESQLKQDKDLSKFVNDFLDERGGIDAVKRDRQRARPPPVPPSIPFQQQSSLPAPPPPPVNTRPPPPASNLTQLICIAS